MPISRFLLLAAVLHGAAWSASAAEFIQPRTGLANSLAKFQSSQRDQAYTKITYFGGSITAGAGASKPERNWRALTHQYLRNQLFPGANLAENNSAIGGTGSWLGAFRIKNQALYGGAALVLIEFAVNDAGAPEPQTLASMEGIVRQIWKADATADIVFIYTVTRSTVDYYVKGELPPTVQYHEKIAAHYGIPSVNVGAVAAEKLRQRELTFEEFAKDGVHPTDRGYQIYFEALQEYFSKAKASAEGAKPSRHALPPPLSAAPMEKAQCVPYEWTKLEGPWKKGRPSPTDTFLHILEGEDPACTLTLRFKGAQAGIFDLIGQNTGNLEISVDGGAWQLRTNWDQYCAQSTRTHAAPLVTGLDPAAWHVLRIRPAEEKPTESAGRLTRIGYVLVDGEVEDPYAKLSPLERIDAQWAELNQPLKVQLAPGRFAHLPKTMQRLRDGASLRIVNLGDSIMGDTVSSQYQLLLQRLYPKCKVENILSNRGSTGCWWYKDENRVQAYVLKYQPDLLVIGGISQREDTESIRAVIQQVRAKQPCEVLLLTPAFGASTDPHIKSWRYEIDPAGTDYRARLQKLAQEENCAFFDMTGPWWQFVKDSGADYGYFRRDKVHANDRGKQILGHLMEQFFMP